MEKIQSEGHLKIWTLSADSNEYERYERLLEASNKHHLSVSKLNACLRDQHLSSLGSSKSILLIHDSSDLRKRYSESMENLDKVRSLEKEMVNGFHSFNSLGIGEDKKLRLLGSQPYGKEGEQSVKELSQAQIQTISEGIKSEYPDTVLIHNLHNLRTLTLRKVLSDHFSLNNISELIPIINVALIYSFF